MKKHVKAGLAIVVAASNLFATQARADAIIIGTPTTWRVQNYIPSVVTMYYTGSSCALGQVSFSSGASTDDLNRFWAMMNTAKTTGKRVGLAYETTSGNCYITSFFMPES